MKRVFALLLCLALMVVTFASCDVFTTVDPNSSTTTPEGEQQQHTHTFSTTWSSDDEGHWYDATCDCEDAPVQKLAHADKNNDGACDVCEYAQCEHTYSEEWTIDCTNHWHAADCGHIVPGTDVAEHVDENADGKCDVCTYIIEDIHKHYYATEWSGDGEYHWHAALCEHSVEIADKAAHEIDAAGYCTVCDAKVKEIDKADVKAVLEAAVARNNKVTGGKVEYANYIYDLVNGNLEASSSSLNEIYYTLGNGASYINWITISEWGNTSNQQWYELISLGETEEETEVFGVTTYDGGVTLEKAAGAMQHLNGYNYMPSTLLASFDSTSTLADTLLAIYTLSQAETASEVEVTYDAETGTYSIAYAYVAINNVDFTNPDDNTQTVTNVETAFFAVAALFTVDENGVVDSAAIVVDSYQDAEFDDDYNYDVATGKVELNENAAPNRYIYSVAQTSGERTYTSAYPKASVLPTSFELSYNDELVGDSITVSAGKFNNLYLVDLVPAVSSLNFINGEIEISAVNNDAENDYTPFPYYSAGEGAVVFYSNQAGSFTLTVTYGDFVKTINVTVEPPKAESIGAYQFEMVSAWGDTWYEASIYSGITNASLNVGETLDFAVLVSPTAAAQGFTYSVDSADASITEVTLTEVMAFDEFFDTYTALQFTSAVEGTYTITLTSTEDANVSSTFVVTVGEEEVEEPVAGATSITLTPTDTYNLMNDNDIYTYLASVAGTYTFTVPANYGVYSLDSYNAWGNPEVDLYDGGGSFSVELAAGEEFSFYFGGITKDEFTITVEVPGGSSAPEVGSGSGTDVDPYIILPGDHTCAFPGGWNQIWYAYVVEESGFVTVSTTLESGWISVGADVYSCVGNDGSGAPVSVYFLAGTTCLIGVGDWNEAALDISFSVSAEAFTSEPFDHLVGTWTASTAWGSSYELVINADGTGSYSEDWGWGPDVYSISYIVVNGDAVLLSCEGAYGTRSINLVYADNTLSDELNGIAFTQGGSSEGGEGGEGEVVADGSFANPFELQESNICDFPGGWNYTFYAYTPEANGTLTISVFGNDFYWGYGYSEWAIENVGQVATLDLTVTAGETIYIGMSTNSANAGVIDFYAFFEAGSVGGGETTTTESDLAIDTTTQINAENATYAYTAGEAGTLTLGAGSAIMGMVEISYSVNGGDSVVVELSTNVEVALNAGDKIVITIVAEGYSSLTTLWTAGAADVAETALVIGHNSINAADVTYAYTAEADGTLTLSAGGAVMGMVEIFYTVNGGDTNVLELNSTVDLALTAGDKVVISVTAEGYSTITASWA